MDQFHELLKKYWGFDAFRPLQLEIIKSVAQKKDTLGLMPTGGGKSITFQVYSMSVPGLCLVVTPLISLMKDQVENLKRKGIRALAIHSGMSSYEVKAALDAAVWGDYKFLYLSPERLATERFIERIPDMKVNLITIDEAHCISQWGYDFRPSYRKITDLRKFLPNIPVLALTATATPKVAEDIQQQLNFREKNVLRKSFFRSNLVYLVRQHEDKESYLLNSVRRAKGSGIIYVNSRKKSRELAQLLCQNGESASYYHAGLSGHERESRQESWKKGETRIIVATNAFGMGIDKPDVRFVIHMGIPDSPEAYYQEAGRAGRDEKRAFAVLIYGKSDIRSLEQKVDRTFPPMKTIRRIYQALGNYLQLAVGYGHNQIFDFKIGDFASNYHFQIQTTLNVLKILQREGFLELTEELDNAPRVQFMVERDELYRFQVENAHIDKFVKVLLRSYSGFFNQYVPIDENLLAKRSEVAVDQVYRFLNYLSAHKIIRYFPRKKTPFLFFNKDRREASDIKISRENYLDRKKDFQQRIDAMIHYVSCDTQCRSQLLLSYFGEKQKEPCGICDVCREQGHSVLDPSKLKILIPRIQDFLQQERTKDDLRMYLKLGDSEVFELIHYLSDKQKITVRSDNRLIWRDL